MVIFNSYFDITRGYIWIIYDRHRSKVFQVQDGSCWISDSVTGTDSTDGWDSHGRMALWLGEAELQDAGCCRGLPVAGIWDGMTKPEYSTDLEWLDGYVFLLPESFIAKSMSPLYSHMFSWKPEILLRFWRAIAFSFTHRGNMPNRTFEDILVHQLFLQVN